MQRDLGDVLDRGTIAKLKFERIKEPETVREWGAFEQELYVAIDKFKKVPVLRLFNLLYSINAMIWDLESDMRQGKLDGVLSEVGRRAIEIRKHNTLRVEVKNIVNALVDEGYMEIKKEHISA